MKDVTAQDPVSREEIRRLAAARIGDLGQAVIDVERRIMVVDGELYADDEAELPPGGSRQQDLRRINLYPSFGNRSRGVDDSTTWPRLPQAVQEAFGSSCR